MGVGRDLVVGVEMLDLLQISRYHAHADFLHFWDLLLFAMEAVCKL